MAEHTEAGWPNQMKKPIALAGMKQIAAAVDGQSVSFEFESDSGKIFAFSAPHEAITEIVENFMIMANGAWERRGSPSEAVTPGKRGTAKFRAVTSLSLSATQQGLILTLQCGALKHDLLLSPDVYTQLNEEIAKGHKEWLRLFPPN